MQFTQRSLQKFKQLYLKEFEEALTDEEAKRKMEYLVELYRAVYGMPNLPEIFDNKIKNEET